MRILITSAYMGFREPLESLGHEVFEVKYYPRFPSIQEMIRECRISPDMIWHTQPELVGLPKDYFDSPIPVLSVPLDYHANFQSLAIAAPVLQGYLLSGGYPVSFFKKMGAEAVEWHSFGCINLQQFSAKRNRPIDVIFVGTVDKSNGYEARSEFIQKLVELVPEWNVKIVAGAHSETTLELYAKSKIVFNHAARSDVLNQRTFDTLAAGALLFTNEENRLALDWLDPGKEVVAYNPDTFVSLLKNFLQNDAERLRMAEAGQKKLVFYRTLYQQQQQSLSRLLSQFTQTPLKGSDPMWTLFSSGLFVSPPLGLELSVLPEKGPVFLNNLAVACWASASYLPSESSERGDLVNKSVALFQNVLEKAPEFLPLRWNLGVFHFLLKNYEASKIHLTAALQLIKGGSLWPFEARNITSFGIIDSFTRRFSQSFTDQKLFGKDNVVEIRSIALEGIFTYLVEIANLRRDHAQALQWLGEWDALEPLVKPTREWLYVTTLQHVSEKESVMRLSRVLSKRPFLFESGYLRKLLYKFWQLGMTNETSELLRHLLKRHVAGSPINEPDSQALDLLGKVEANHSPLECLSDLENLDELCDVLSSASG